MEVLPVDGLPEIGPDDDLAALIEAHADLADGDVLCVASTVLSKAEGRLYMLDDFEAGDRAEAIAERLTEISGEAKDPRFAQAVLDESEALVLEAPFLLTATRFGHIGVNAGIDRSNVPPEWDLLLLPDAPRESARRVRDNLTADVGVVVTDTSGRPFRHGQRGVAIGWAGLPAMRDWRGETDREGYELEVTNEAVVDELAAAANLLFGEGDDGRPAAVVRDFQFGEHAGSDLLFREREADLVRQALEAWEYPGG
jgi:coenzyme F420-0:L-glutamate ligase/coenzyme F420-1:gamma-L-glutamate ligase